MKITYRITFDNGNTAEVTLDARDVNSGFTNVSRDLRSFPGEEVTKIERTP